MRWLPGSHDWGVCGPWAVWLLLAIEDEYFVRLGFVWEVGLPLPSKPRPHRAGRGSEMKHPVLHGVDG